MKTFKEFLNEANTSPHSEAFDKIKKDNSPYSLGAENMSFNREDGSINLLYTDASKRDESIKKNAEDGYRHT